MSAAIDDLLNRIDRARAPARQRETLVALWEQERWFDTRRQRRAAEIARDAFVAGGLAQVEILPFAADGVTRFQDWTTPLAWDCDAARLSCGDEVLADRQVSPCAAVQWSGPLVETEAEVVDGDATPDLAAVAKGRFVLTGKGPRDAKQLLRGSGARAVVSDHAGKAQWPDDRVTAWCNAWGDGPDGWHFRKCDEPLAGFCLSRAAGARLRALLKARPGLRLQAFCRSRLYAGESQCVTAVLPGEDPSREIWLYGHAAEEGANDNASGVSALIESASLLSRLVEHGDLPQPRFNIRFFATVECIGTLALATLRPEWRSRALAGLNVDCVGAAPTNEQPFKLYYGSHAAPGFAWPAAGIVSDALQARFGPAFPVQAVYEVPVEDDMLADPLCGIPSAGLGQSTKSFAYHTDADTPACCEEASMRASTLFSAAWGYLLARLDAPLAAALMAPATAWLQANLLPADGEDAKRLRRWSAATVLRDLSRWGLPPQTYESAAAAFAPAGTPPLDDLPDGGPRYRRSVWGVPTWDTLPEIERKDLSRWSGWQSAALFWNHPPRSPQALARLVAADTGLPAGADVEGLLEKAVQAGWAERQSVR